MVTVVFYLKFLKILILRLELRSAVPLSYIPNPLGFSIFLFEAGPC